MVLLLVIEMLSLAYCVYITHDNEHEDEHDNQVQNGKATDATTNGISGDDGHDDTNKSDR